MESKVLIVDDNPVNRRILTAMLDREGYTSVEAETGEEALQLARVLDPDVILLDVMMPGMDGYQVCRSLRLDPDFEDTPVLFLSALHDAKDKVAGFDSGASDFITKPYIQSEVLARVKRSLSQKRKMRRIRTRQFEMEADSQKMKESLEAAVILQQSMLPSKERPMEGVATAWARRCPEGISTELLSFARLDENTLAIWLLDAGGEGISGAVASIAVARLLNQRSGGLLRPKLSQLPGFYNAQPAEVLKALDRAVSFGEIDDHFGLRYMLLDIPTGFLSYAHFGRPAPMVLRDKGQVDWLEGHLPPDGTTAHGGFYQGEAKLKAGDRLYLFSDGVTLALNERGQSFGAGRVESLLQAMRQRSIKEGLDTVQVAVGDHLGKGKDQCRSLLGLEYLGAKLWA